MTGIFLENCWHSERESAIVKGRRETRAGAKTRLEPIFERRRGDVKTTLVFSHMEESARARAAFNEKAGKIAKHLKRFGDDLVYLHAALDKNPHKEEFHVSLTLYLPTTTAHARERAPEYAAAFN